MNTLARWVRRLDHWLHRDRYDADLREEMEFHRALAGDRAFGNATLAREDARGVWVFEGLERIWRDAVYGARALRSQPAFALTALATLTVGMATTITVFSVVDAELWKPLPFPDPAQLVSVHSWRPGAGADTEPVSGPDFLDWRTQARLADYAAELPFERRVLRRAGSESVLVKPVTANYFAVLEHAPRIGRAFRPGEDDRAQRALLSDNGWRRLFEADPAVIGRSVSLDGDDFTIVGISAGQHLEFGTEPDLFVTVDAAAAPLHDRQARRLTITGRVHPGVSVAQAQSELQTIAARIADAFPEDHAGHRIEFADLRLSYSGHNWRPLLLCLAAAAVVLLLSCLNVANLLLSRTLRRQREFAIRGALGGGLAALVRQLLIEGTLLALPSAAAACLVSMWAVQLLATVMPSDYLERGGHVRLDGRIVAFAIVVSAATTILLSLTPVLFARRVELTAAIGPGGRTAGRSPRQRRARTALLVSQLALTLVLLVGAALFGISFMKLLHAPLGFDPDGRAAVRLTFSGPRYEGDAAARAAADRLVERARATPGVIDAAIGSSAPLSSGPIVRLIAADRRRPPPGSEPSALARAVTPGYFRTLGIRIVTGRAFGAADTAGAARVAIVSEYLAARLFPRDNAVGRTLELVPGARVPWTRRPGFVVIVGVAPNVKDVGINEVEFGDLYLPFAQAPAPAVEVIVRSASAAAPLAKALREAVAAVDPDLPVARVDAMADRVAAVLRGDRFNLVLIGSFAAVALLLAAVGIYGAMACAVQERTREFGVRLALGQQPGAVVRETLWESARYGLVGSLTGGAIVFVLARLLGNALYLVRGEHSGLLYGVTTTDPAALALAVAALIVIAALSGLVPARQATRVDPLIVLRSE